MQLARLRQLSMDFSLLYQRSPRGQSPIVVGGRRAQILGVLSRARMSLAHYEIIVDAGSSDVCVENDVDALTRRQTSALETVVLDPRAGVVTGHHLPAKVVLSASMSRPIAS